MSDKQCPCCMRKGVGPIRTWRRNSAYVNDELNYITCCHRCITEDDWHLHHDWEEYYYSQGWGRSSPFKPRSQKDYVK